MSTSLHIERLPDAGTHYMARQKQKLLSYNAAGSNRLTLDSYNPGLFNKGFPDNKQGRVIIDYC